MATYYVCSSTGSDANNGLGPDASHASNKPWLTIQKCLGAAGISSGDTVYIGPGTYREVVTVAMTSAVAETSVLGDPGNAQGFKTAAGVLVSAAEVIWTAYTTNDTTAPSASATLNLAGRDFLTFQYITFVQGSSYVVQADTNTSTNITIRDCSLMATGTTNMISITGAFSVVANWLVERTVFFGSGASVFNIQPATGAGADWDLGFVVRNCAYYGAGSSSGFLAVVQASGGLANKPGGVLVYNCTVIGAGIMWTATDVSTTIPCQVNNSVNVAFSVGGSVKATTLGMLVENYNYLRNSTTHNNVTQGANTVTNNNRAPTWNAGQELLYGWTPRMFMEPKTGSWPLTFGNDGTYTTAEDFLGLPRPGGGASATKGIGYLGRGNTFTKETGTVRTGTNAMSITGPGTQDFQLPVDATSTTASVYVRWDATYAGTKPLMKVLNGGECGVTDATATATGASGSWEQLSLNFTPARAGIVTIRLQSSDTNGAGVMYVDDFAVT